MNANTKTVEHFIECARKVHGDLYLYDKAIYKGSQFLIEIVCKKHGSFWQKPNSHVSSKNICPKCSHEARFLTTTIFIERANKMHNNKYNYELTIYTHSHEKLAIKCSEHGIYMQTAADHLNGKGCRQCSNEKHILGSDTFIKRARFVHGNLYGYDSVEYINFITPTNIRCFQHGIFMQRPGNHLAGEGCIKCRPMPQMEFIRRSLEKHGDRYDYSLVNYIGSKHDVIVICKKHGLFEQRADAHMDGSGCPRCVKSVSIMELKWLKSLNCTTLERQATKTINGKRFRFDGFDPITNTVYEFYGDYWHGNPTKFKPEDINPASKYTFGELYDNTMKREASLRAAGYKIVSIWETDWNKIKGKL